MIRERIVFNLEVYKDEILKVGKEENILHKDIYFAINIIDESIELLPKLTVTTVRELILSVPKTNIENPVEKLHPSIRGIVDNVIEKTLATIFINHLFLIILFSPISVLLISYFLLKNTFKNIKDKIIVSITQQSDRNLEMSLL